MRNIIINKQDIVACYEKNSYCYIVIRNFKKLCCDVDSYDGLGNFTGQSTYALILDKTSNNLIEVTMFNDNDDIMSDL